MAYSEKATEAQQEASIEHAEHERGLSHVLASQVQYDNAGLGGILRSPYVFGAALLASFGGFSFGYGKNRIPLYGLPRGLC